MTIYKDGEGTLYFVRGGCSDTTFKGFKRFIKPNGVSKETGLRTLVYRNSLEEAQADLDAYAKKKGWEAVE